MYIKITGNDICILNLLVHNLAYIYMYPTGLYMNLYLFGEWSVDLLHQFISVINFLDGLIDWILIGCWFILENGGQSRGTKTSSVLFHKSKKWICKGGR